MYSIMFENLNELFSEGKLCNLSFEYKRQDCDDDCEHDYEDVPYLSYMHLLQTDYVSNEKLEKLIDLPIGIIKDDSDNHFIGCFWAGYNGADYIAYAYMVMDGEIPLGLMERLIGKERSDCLSQEQFEELVDHVSVHYKRNSSKRHDIQIWLESLEFLTV